MRVRHLMTLLAGVAVAALVAVFVPAPAAADEPPFDRGIDGACHTVAQNFDPFPDTGPSAHHASINCAAFLGVTQGRDGPSYDTEPAVSRAQMASFVVALLDRVEDYELSQETDHPFADVEGTHETSIARLTDAGIVEGVEPDRFDPRERVPRDQMASFIVGAIEAVTGEDLPVADVFTDDDFLDVHVESVGKLAAIGVVQGVDGTTYAPRADVSRAAMATFLVTALSYLADEGFEIVAATPEFPQTVSSFTTPLTPGQDRNVNIHRAADLLEGQVIAPGEVFSLDAAIGERTTARGFVSNGFIDGDGNVISVVGGGVSQIATTFFNAAWYSGIHLLEHQPHSQYFERYPPGREATIAWQTIDVVVENDTPFPITIATGYDESQITIAFVSTPWLEVDDWLDAPADPVDGQAFSVQYGRTVTYLDGTSADESYQWTYEAA